MSKNKHSAAFSRERVRNSHSPNFEMSITRQENSQSIQTLLSGKQPLNSPSYLKRDPECLFFVAVSCTMLNQTLANGTLAWVWMSQLCLLHKGSSLFGKNNCIFLAWMARAEKPIFKLFGWPQDPKMVPLSNHRTVGWWLGAFAFSLSV